MVPIVKLLSLASAKQWGSGLESKGHTEVTYKETSRTFHFRTCARERFAKQQSINVQEQC